MSFWTRRRRQWSVVYSLFRLSLVAIGSSLQNFQACFVNFSWHAPEIIARVVFSISMSACVANWCRPRTMRGRHVTNYGGRFVWLQAESAQSALFHTFQSLRTVTNSFMIGRISRHSFEAPRTFFRVGKERRLTSLQTCQFKRFDSKCFIFLDYRTWGADWY